MSFVSVFPRVDSPPNVTPPIRKYIIKLWLAALMEYFSYITAFQYLFSVYQLGVQKGCNYLVHNL